MLREDDAECSDAAGLYPYKLTMQHLQQQLEQHIHMLSGWIDMKSV
jgi:hypothetical protein